MGEGVAEGTGVRVRVGVAVGRGVGVRVTVDVADGATVRVGVFVGTRVVVRVTVDVREAVAARTVRVAVAALETPLACTSAAARRPDSYAPCTVPKCRRLVASPAKNRRPLTGAARVSRMAGFDPSEFDEYDPRAWGSAPHLVTRVATGDGMPLP